MSERASVYEKPRFGVEDIAAPGDPVAATHILQSLTIIPSPMLVRNAIKAAGSKGPVGVTSGKQHTELSIDGSLCYLDLAYMLNSALCIATVTAGGASGVSRLTWIPKRDQADPLQTYTIEMGSSAGSGMVPGVFLTDLSISFTKQEVKMSAKAIGKRYDEGVTLTPNPTDVPIVNVSIATVSVFVSDTLAGLDDPSARLKRCNSASWGLSGRQSALFCLDDQEGSFSASVERDYDQTAQITLMENSQGVAMMNRMRQEEIFYVRYETIGRDIVEGTPYRLRITFPAYVDKTQRSDVDDVYAGVYDLTPTNKTDAFGSGKTGRVMVEMDVPTAFASGIATANTAATGYDTTVEGAEEEESGV